jgi:hypothetical protein
MKKQYVVIDILENGGGDICKTKEEVMDYCGYSVDMDWEEFLILITGGKQVMEVNGDVSWIA